jgi:hypothetical protein
MLRIAKLLASPIRRDRLAEQVLPRNLLLKYIIYSAADDETHWLMPCDLSPTPKTGAGHAVRGVYGRLNHRAVEELGARQRRWKSNVPERTTPAVRKSLVWRDGMAEWIAGVLRRESWIRLDGLRRMYLFGCEVDGDVLRAVVGGSIGKRIKMRKEKEAEEEGLVDKEGHEGAEVEGSSEPVLEGVTLPEIALETETTDQFEAQSSAVQTESTVLEDLPTNDQDNKDPIIAVLYLSPPETSVPWEFQSIHIEGQETSAVVFNLRRLFPATAESFMKLRIGEGNAVAMMSSEMTCTIMYYMLRLALYLEGEGGNDSLADGVEEGNVDADVESGNELKADVV